jgi:hypothetical protein
VKSVKSIDKNIDKKIKLNIILLMCEITKLKHQSVSYINIVCCCILVF